MHYITYLLLFMGYSLDQSLELHLKFHRLSLEVAGKLLSDYSIVAGVKDLTLFRMHNTMTLSLQ